MDYDFPHEQHKPAQRGRMQKIAILADIHGNIAALEKVVDDLHNRDVDTVVTLGDQISGPLWPRETAQFLLKQNWFQIAGNHDRQLVSKDPSTFGLTDQYTDSVIDEVERNWLRSLPASLCIEGDILLFHGTPGSDSAYLLETIQQGRVHLSTQEEIQARLADSKNRVLLCGHTHIPRVVQLSNGTLIVNPGSVGLPAYTDNTPENHIVETGSPCARYAILEKSQNQWRVDLISLPYDFEKAASRARENHRLEWEHWLATGYAG